MSWSAAPDSAATSASRELSLLEPSPELLSSSSRACFRFVDQGPEGAYKLVMKTANIAEFKMSLSRFIADVERGEEVEIRRRNLPIARVVPIPSSKRNETKLGAGAATVRILGDLTEPLIDETEWEMHRGDGE